MHDDGPTECEGEIDHGTGDQYGEWVETDGGVTRLEAVLKCLTRRRRRFVLYYLEDHEIATVDELATAIAASEAEQPAEAVTADQRRAVATDLVHRHLPRLRDGRLVEYDDRSETIRFAEPPPMLEQLLNLLATLEHRSIDNE